MPGRKMWLQPSKFEEFRKSILGKAEQEGSCPHSVKGEVSHWSLGMTHTHSDV